ncbi:MAG TPA: 50S ribosomal protein L15 [Candidatus Aminicenantes bacterium]|nr:50S ribosomal protein L15 [Candidatus Aminicenantes bacterium]HPL14287.1 50S ribosomal protein L15 [Candidatus Aminicenantes bacterium]
MNLSQLQPAKGARKKDRRVGRGPGSGRGKTSGRGHKGQLSGAGYKAMRGFEGGQMPLVRRIPKRGFTNIFRHEPAVLNLDRLAKIAGAEIGPAEMAAAGFLKPASARVKILGRGEIAEAKTVRAHHFSAAAVKKIEAAGGKAVVIE